MKKYFIFFSLILLGLTCCNGKENGPIDSTAGSVQSTTASTQPIKGKVELTADNYVNYIAINTNMVIINSSYDTMYYSYFIGSNHCKFIDCKLTYKYVSNSGSAESSTGTIPLTLSGDGQANPFYVRSPNRGVYYSIVIITATGTVQIL